MRCRARALRFIRRSVNEWAGVLIPAFRGITHVTLFNVLVDHLHSVCIPSVRLIIPVPVMAAVIYALYIPLMLSDIRMTESRGGLYEVCYAFLEFELVLFLDFLQYHPAAAVLLTAAFSGGLLALLLYGRRRSGAAVSGIRLPRGLMKDLIITSRRQKRPTVLAIALRRYLVIAPALLLLAPTAITLTADGLDGGLYRDRTAVLMERAVVSRMPDSLDDLRLLTEDKWKGLPESEKIGVLQTVADIEAYRLGIRRVTVVNRRLPDQTYGLFDTMWGRVQIDLAKHERLEPLGCLNTVLHECRHAYQWERVASIDWNDPAAESGPSDGFLISWRDEYADYKEAADGYDGYFAQEIERDARRYAQEEADVYLEYLGGLAAR